MDVQTVSSKMDVHVKEGMQRFSAARSSSDFGSGTGARTLNLTVNRIAGLPFRNCGVTSHSATECRRLPWFITGVAVRDIFWLALAQVSWIPVDVGGLSRRGVPVLPLKQC
jgi:hypothetical protein